MVVALLALSSVMILGGAAAVVQGFPYVRLESGLAMVIGGSTAASAGVVLLGLTAIVHRLRRLHGAVESLRAAAPPLGIPAAAPAGTAPWEAAAPEAPAFAAPEVSPPDRPSLAGLGMAGAGAAGLAGLSIGALRPGARGAEPVFEDPAPAADPQPSAAEPLLPDLLPEAAPPRAGDDDLFRGPEPEAERAPALPEPVTPPDPAAEERDEARSPAAEPIGLRSFLDEPAPTPVPQPEPEAVAPQAIAAHETEAREAAPEANAPEERHAVGSYASGANTYVMFSDGSIEADTPRGRFTFASLDELKSFVNAGGEEARGAA